MVLMLYLTWCYFIRNFTNKFTIATSSLWRGNSSRGKGKAQLELPSRLVV